MTRLLEGLTFESGDHQPDVEDAKDELLKQQQKDMEGMKRAFEQQQKEIEELKKANAGEKGKAEVWVFVIFL